MMRMATDSFDAFLSHHSNDKPVVKMVAEALERARVRPWLDAWHLVPGEVWQPALEDALRKSDCCVVFVGPSGIGAWQHEEMRAAINRRVIAARSGRPFRVIPVLLPGAVRGYRSDLPEFLTATTWVEFRSSDDTVALRTLERAIRGLPPREERAPIDNQCPYRGLDVFDVDNTDLFFGRESVTDWLLSVLRGTQSARGPSRFLAIVGASGSGKSSLARAGVIAALKRGEITGSENWLVTICKPGPRPLESLANSLAANPSIKLGEGLSTKLARDLIESLRGHANELHLTSDRNLPVDNTHVRHVVLIDQFEEIFSQCQDADERRAFIDNLLHAGRVSGGRTIVLLTMRADFYEACAEHETLSASISENNFLLRPLSDAELRSAIERPTQMCRGTVEPGLTELLIHDMAGQEQALPLLQHALRQLWDAAATTGLRLTVEAYKTLGGLQGALDQHANAVFERLSADQRHICRDVMVALVNHAGSARETRRRLAFDDLVAQVEHAGDAASIIRLLANERLIVTSGTMDAASSSSPDESAVATVELIHESLVHGWSKLRGWLEEIRLEAATPRGKAKRRLAELADAYANAPESRNLPSLIEYVRIRRHVASRAWTGAQRRLMRAASRRFGLAAALALLVLIAGGVVAQRFVAKQQQERAEIAVNAALNAPADALPYALNDVEKLASYARPILERRFGEGPTGIANDDLTPTQQLHGLCALAAVGNVRVGELVKQVTRTPPHPRGECANIAAALNRSRDAALVEIGREANQLVEDKSLQAHARLAIVALALDGLDLANSMCRLRPDPAERTVFIAEFPVWHGDLTKLAESVVRRGAELEPSTRSALCLALGSVPQAERKITDHSAWKPLLETWFTTHPDSGVHSAAGFAMRSWQMEEPSIDARVTPAAKYDWMRTTSGLTLIRVPAGRFTRKDDDDSNATSQVVTFHRDLWLCDREVSVGLFREFIADEKYARDRPDEAIVNWDGEQVTASPTSGHPVQQVSWDDTVAFCNWLSWREGRKMCYTRKVSMEGAESNVGEWVLDATAEGYRLPTEAEWEYACRAGTTTDWASGSDESQLSRYAVFGERKAAHCGSKLSNGWGLYDLHGNVWEWCQDWYGGYGVANEADDPLGAREGSGRVSRGGCWIYSARYCRSAIRFGSRPDNRYFGLGFRVALVPSRKKLSSSK